MNDTDRRIVVVDLRIPFFRLVFFFVKAALAAIPAAIILSLIGTLAAAITVALLGGHSDFMMRRL